MKLLTRIKKSVSNYLDRHTQKIFDPIDEKPHRFPKSVVWLVYIMCMSVLFQGIMDVVLKVLGYTPFVTRFPWRVDFLFLTAISVLMGYQALVGIRRREMDVTKNSVQVGLLVEVALVVGDIFFIAQYEEVATALAFRLPFVILTSINIVILGYLIYSLKLFTDEKGKLKLF
jgi:hypothetical protein